MAACSVRISTRGEVVHGMSMLSIGKASASTLDDNRGESVGEAGPGDVEVEVEADDV